MIMERGGERFQLPAAKARGDGRRLRYDRPFMCAETDGVTNPTASPNCNVLSVRGNTPGRRRPRVHLASMPPAITLAPVQPTYGDGRVGAALSHIAKRRSLRCPDQGRLGDRSVSAIQHCTSEAASPLSTHNGHRTGPLVLDAAIATAKPVVGHSRAFTACRSYAAAKGCMAVSSAP